MTELVPNCVGDGFWLFYERFDDEPVLAELRFSVRRKRVND